MLVYRNNEKEDGYMTNREFMENDVVFKKACELSKTKKTKRQASKWRNGKGLAKRMHGTAASWLKRNSK